MPLSRTAIYARPHFRWDELRCRGCDGSCLHSRDGKPLANPTEASLDKLEALRNAVGIPLHLNSASRCPLHNARVGGAPLSQHRATAVRQSTAYDILIRGIDKWQLIRAAEDVGFGGIGTGYRSFVHVDDRGHRARW
ncbi:D-Ala-D-Ala carboxypeptidase family metallohydrolase [Marinibaculum pumilum]|uniref:D-Ala-D-Ala carboxypeptidase family metallohydrolase n=1 Tax=Marinibaculum pumilum TaxID=1766165 RepID=A0ABV7L9Q3_9PROT